MIAGCGCKPPSLDYLRLLSADITEGEPKRSLGTEALTRAEPEVRSQMGWTSNAAAIAAIPITEALLLRSRSR
jgi:hypothetical protein